MPKFFLCQDDDKEQSTTSRESSDRNVQQKDLPTSNAAIQPSFCEPTTVEPEHETSKSKSEEKLDKKNSEAGRKSRGAKRTTTTANESGAKAKKAKSDSQDRATIKSALAETNEGDKPNENGESSSDDTDKKRLELEKRLLEKYGFVMVEVAISNEPMISQDLIKFDPIRPFCFRFMLLWSKAIKIHIIFIVILLTCFIHNKCTDNKKFKFKIY